MSREIKFRAWDVNKGRFVIESDHVHVALTGNVSHCSDSGISNRNDLALQQYTGLKDKNGVEIYEGDVLEYISPEPQDDDRTDHYVVEWRFKEFVGVWLKDRSFKNRDNDGLIDPHLDMIVIGNIYNNPELC